MRNPARNALYALLAGLAAAASVWFGAERLERVGEDWIGVVPVVLGLATAPFALVILVQALFAIRGRARLLAGHGVVARWRVHPVEWERFRGLDRRRGGEGFERVNELGVREAIPAAGVEVIVGEKGVLVDDSYHGLSPRGLPELREIGWLAGPPRCLEFVLLYPRGRYGGNQRATLRIPVPAGAVGAAQRVFDHFEPRLRRRPGLALRNPRLTYRVCALLLAAAVAAAGAGYLSDVPRGTGALLPMVLLLGGIVLAVFAALLALATWLLSRK